LQADLMPDKPITRRTVLSRRDTMPEAERRAASGAIAASVDRLLGSQAAGSIVALYAPKGTEVETAVLDGLARARGLRVVYPRIVDGDRRLAFHEATYGELAASRFGLSEPAKDARRVETADISVFVIPGLAFDRHGWRVGWGRGYYDATLAVAPRARRIGIAFECQLVDEVPRDVHDARMHHVVTEANVYAGEVD
jgi:5-formyltetrahydrofolate cyclo-ligase